MEVTIGLNLLITPNPTLWVSLRQFIIIKKIKHPKSHSRTFVVPEDFVREVKRNLKREKNEIWYGSGESPVHFENSNHVPLPQQHTHTQNHNKKMKHEAEAGKRVKGYRIGRRELSRLFKSIFLPTPNYLRVFRPFFGNFEVSLSNSSKSKSPDWMDPLMRQFFPFMGSETKKLIPNCTLRCRR